MTGPIFLLGIQRGGTNQVLNILRSHPATTWPQGEFHEVFRVPSWRAVPGLGLRRSLRALRAYAPIRLTAGDILDPDRRPEGQRLLRGARGRAVVAGLARSVAANRAGVLAYKAALVERGLIDGGIAPSRTVVKVMNGNLAFAEDLAALYPGAVFVGLIRDGRAVCEGHIARGAGLEAAAEAYAFVGRRLTELEAAGLPLRTWRFEDLLVDPEGVSRAILAFAGLEAGAVRGVCLQDKTRRLDAEGRVRGIEKEARFYNFAEVARHMRADANAGALARMPAEARVAVEQRAADVLERFGYAQAAPPGGRRPMTELKAPAIHPAGDNGKCKGQGLALEDESATLGPLRFRK